jgi:hypothetical protein
LSEEEAKLRTLYCDEYNEKRQNIIDQLETLINKDFNAEVATRKGPRDSYETFS